MKTNSYCFFFIVICLSFQGCNTKHSELKPGDFLYENAHVFAHSFNESVLTQIHLYNEDAGYWKTCGGPNEMEIICGNKSNHYRLKVKSTRMINRNQQEIVFSYYGDEDGRSNGTVMVRSDKSLDTPKSIVLMNNNNNLIVFDNPVGLHRHEVLGEIDFSLCDDGEEEIKNVSDLASMFTYFNCSDSWSLADKNLMLYLIKGKDPSKSNYSQLKDNWDMAVSPDGVIRTFVSWYYVRGNGIGSFWPQDIMYYRSEETNHIIPGFYDWVYAKEDCKDNNLVDGYFPLLDEQSIKTWGKGDQTIYFFELTFQDERPQPFKDNDWDYTKEFFSIIGAFRIVDGSIIPAEVFKSKKETLNSICVASTQKVPHFVIDPIKGFLGVPLIDTNDYKHHGKFILYEWNPTSQLFEYNGRKERL